MALPVASTWQDKARHCFAKDRRPVVLFDGVCNLCNGGVNFVLDSDQAGKLRLAALQSGTGRALLRRAGRSPEDISSIVLVEEDRAYTKSDAVLRIAGYLPQPYPSLSALGMSFPSFFRDMIYDVVATNRYLLFGKTDQCRVSDARLAERFLE